ncbi:MAG: LON peptidase substrate-binding domain-containing protein [Caldilineaceae bacterium]|nr:LON peptidase substrate-binding domain-containing protein [Caldilineaceae bacterium]
MNNQEHSDAGHRRSRIDLQDMIDSERSEGEPMHLPLFPLNVVLFPGMMLPLHVFEPRYREMISHCIETKSPFGVVLIRKGKEVGGFAIPQDIGTTARIVKTKREKDGRMNIIAIGARRFKINELDYSRPYLSAHVSEHPIVDEQNQTTAALGERLRPKLLEYAELLSTVHDTKMQLSRIPQEPKMLAYMLAIALQVGNEEKQQLLEAESVAQLLRAENKILNREMLLTRYMLETQSELNAMSSGPTGYIFSN